LARRRGNVTAMSEAAYEEPNPTGASDRADRPPRPSSRGCELYEVATDLVDCRFKDEEFCDGRCHVISWPENDPDAWRDEGRGPITKERGRVYGCGCVKRE
jgi:hypothetical protein